MADKSDMAEAKLLESGKRARKLISELDSPHLTIDEMANILTLISVEESVLDRWLSALEQIHEKGAKEFYTQSPTQAQVVGLDSASIQLVDVANNAEPWFIEKVRRTFNMTCRIQFAKKMNKLDALSQIGALAFEDPRDSEKWISVNPQAWTAWGTRGSNAIIRGAVKRGKTNLALLFAEYFIAAGYQVISNVIVVDPPKGYTYCPKLSSMLVAVCDARLSGVDVLLLMDESNLFWQKIETIMPKNISLSKLILTFGKMHANLLFISHYEELVPTIVSKTAVAVFEKKAVKECFVTVTEGIKLRPKLLTAVPATTMKYDPDQLAYFSIDLSVDHLFDYMAALPGGTNQWKAVLDYVAKHRGETGEDQLDPKDIAKWLRKHGRSERQIAEIVQRSPSTVHDWVS
jgi:hypothetical protein